CRTSWTPWSTGRARGTEDGRDRIRVRSRQCSTIRGETMSGSEGGNPARNFAPRKVQPDGVSLQPSTELAHRRPGLVAAPGVAAGSVLGPGPRGLELLGPRRRSRRVGRPG